jgi:hypothetical protein
MNTYHVEVEFPELPGGVMRQNARSQAVRPSAAIARAMREILARRGIKGKRINQIKILCVKVKAINHAEKET